MPRWTTSIDRLRETRTLSDLEIIELLEASDEGSLQKLCKEAREVCDANYGKEVYIRGLIELTNVCKNDCYYCGIRRSNREVARYRLNEEEVLTSCEYGYGLGFRTFVFQGGEDPMWNAPRLKRLIRSMRERFEDCAITLSLGEWPLEIYKDFLECGANRYLLRHETFDHEHYHYLHPKEMSPAYRQECLLELKRLGFQTGTGIMVGSPGQTVEHLLQDIRFIEELKPEMIGIGPFLPHNQTPFADREKGSLELTLRLLAIFRLMHPKALIPSSTALASISSDARTRGILAGANVVMPNLSPREQRKKYQLYNNKAALGAESAEGLAILSEQLSAVGYRLSHRRGDYIEYDTLQS